MKLSDIVVDENIYPRGNISQKTVDEYTEAMKAGVIFSQIVLQKIMKDGEEQIIILDGVHRKYAYNEYLKWFKEQDDETKRNKLGTLWWNDEVLDYNDNFEKLLTIATQLNLKHGVRLKPSDFKEVCLRIVENRCLDELTGIINELANTFDILPNTMRSLIGPAVNRRRASRDDKIYRMSKMGNTQKEIGEAFNLSDNRISEILGNMKNHISEILKIGFKSGKSFEKMAAENELHPLTPYVEHLEDKSDLEKIEIFLEQNPRLYDMWNFQSRDERLGIKSPGNIAGQIMINLLYYYTKQGDWVLDPMAGGGSTIDACLVMGRKCIAFDSNSLRNDIIPNDSTESIPIKKKIDLIFLDPPYYNMVNKIGNYKDLEDFYDQIDKIIKQSTIHLKINGYIAVIMGNLTAKQDTCISHECYNILKDNGLKFINHISVPHSTEQYNAAQVVKYKELKQLMAINRDLYIFQKVGDGNG